MTLALIRELASKLPSATEDVKWGNDLCFCVAKKMFCVMGMEGPVSVSFKVTDEEFAELQERTGFTPAPYMARNKWILVDSSARISKKELSFFIEQSYTLIRSKLPKKVQATL